MSDLPVRRRRRASAEAAGIDPDLAEEIREEYLSHEAAVRSIGILYFLSAIFCGTGALVFPFIDDRDASSVSTFVAASIMLLFAIAFFQAGIYMRRLDPRIRTPAACLAALGLLGIPLGTLINAYILYLLLSKKGERVFSKKYRKVIKATPHIKYKTSIIVWIFLGMLLCVVGLIMIAFLVSAFK